MLSLDDFSETLRRIYSAAADPSEWEAALAAIEDITGSVGAVLDIVPRMGDPPHTLAGRFTAEQCAEFSTNYQHICRRIAYAQAHPEVTLHYDALVISDDEIERNPVYAWLGTHGLRYFLGGPVLSTDRFLIYWSLQRAPEQGHAQPADFELFERLRPHLTQALDMATRWGTLGGTRRLDRLLFEHSAHSCFLLDRRARLLLANRRAERLLGGGGFRIEEGRLRLAAAGDQDRLDRLIRDAADAELPAPGGWFRLARADRSTTYAVLVSPVVLPREGTELDEAAVLVTVIDPYRTVEANHEALQQLFHLTRAETALAMALGKGHGLQSAAATLGMSVETVRTHLKAIFAKTATHRQQDLIRLLSSLQVDTGHS